MSDKKYIEPEEESIMAKEPELAHNYVLKNVELVVKDDVAPYDYDEFMDRLDSYDRDDLDDETQWVSSDIAFHEIKNHILEYAD